MRISSGVSVVPALFYICETLSCLANAGGRPQASGYEPRTVLAELGDPGALPGLVDAHLLVPLLQPGRVCLDEPFLC